MDLQPGERVLLVGEGGSRWDAIVPLLRAGVRAAGGVDLGAVDVLGAVLGAGEPVAGAGSAAGEPAEFAASLGTAPEGWMEPLATVDVAVKLPGAVADPTLESDVYRALQDVLRGGRDGRFTSTGPAPPRSRWRSLPSTTGWTASTGCGAGHGLRGPRRRARGLRGGADERAGAGDDARWHRHHLPCGRRTGDAPGRGRVGRACGTCAQPD